MREIGAVVVFTITLLRFRPQRSFVVFAGGSGYRLGGLGGDSFQGGDEYPCLPGKTTFRILFEVFLDRPQIGAVARAFPRFLFDLFLALDTHRGGDWFQARCFLRFFLELGDLKVGNIEVAPLGVGLAVLLVTGQVIAVLDFFPVIVFDFFPGLDPCGRRLQARYLCTATRRASGKAEVSLDAAFHPRLLFALRGDLDFADDALEGLFDLQVAIHLFEQLAGVQAIAPVAIRRDAARFGGVGDQRAGRGADACQATFC